MKDSLQCVKSFRQESKRGSALLTAIIFSFIVAILMGSYLKLASTEYRISSRSYMLNGSFNLAEGGVELAMDAMNRSDSSGWNSSSYSGDSYWARTYSGYDLGGGLQGLISVVIVEPNGSTPTIYSQGIITGSTVGGDMTRQITVTMDAGSYPFSNASTSKSYTKFTGNKSYVDSYSFLAGPYGPTNRGSEATVASTDVSVDAVEINHADIYGFVATGGSAPKVGKNGSITEYGSSIQKDDSRVTTDFYANFSPVSAPAGIPVLIFPNNATVFTGGTYRVNSWSSAGGNKLIIAADVKLVVKNDMSMSGNAEIIVKDGASLEIYVEGNVSLGGNGVSNGATGASDPRQLKIFGTNTTAGGQSISVKGNAALSAVVYAPNADLTISGGGSNGAVYGSMVGNTVTFNGNVEFHWPIELADESMDDGGFTVDDWVEMNSVGLNTKPIDLSVYGL